MQASRTLRRAVTVTASPALVVALALAVALSLAPSGAWAAPAPAPSSDADLRLVVRTTTRAAAADVVAAAKQRGARPAGRIGRLRAVALDVPASAAERVQRVLLRRDDVRSVDAAHRRWLSAEPSDPRFGDQRSYLAAVRATVAWDRPARGAANVRIAVVDSGVDVTHPDLVGKIAGRFNAVTGSTDVRDVVGHGTGVASVAAAATNNGTGMAGAGWDSTVLAVKVADRTGRIFTDDLAAGIVWAVDSGADVINLSLGGPSSDRLERDAIDYARKAGVLVVAAAGNTGATGKQYPAAHPDVLSVGATNAAGSARAPFSTFGSWVDVAAPGRDIVVAVPGGGYAKADGTSFSSPLVAGQVALLEAHRPGRTSAELSAAVTRSTTAAKFGFARGLVDFAGSLDLLPPGSAPTITSPAGGSQVSGVASVGVASSAPRVRVTLADLSTSVATQGGVATATFPTYGLAGPQTVTAADCSRIDQCGGAAASTTVSVANGAPALTSPADGSAADADTVRATAQAPGGAVRFLVDGRNRGTDATAPYAADLSTEELADGQHTVSAVLCRSDGSVCDTGGAASATVSVTRLHPRITGTSTALLSPGKDGRKDRTTVRYRLDSKQVVTLRVRKASGALVLTRRLGEQPAGDASVVWDGRGDNGRFVANGAYTLEVSTRQPGGPLVGLASRSIVVDRARPRVKRVRTSSSTVYPVTDRHLDKVTVSGVATEAPRWLRLEVRSGSGTLVLTKRTKGGPAGARELVWNGRTRSGRIVPAGAYSVRVLAQDRAGNRSRSAARTVRVSRERLVRRTGSMTVTARQSLREAFSDECSLVFRHTQGARAGWIGYYSSGACSSDDAYAVGDHQVRLPTAVRYGWVRLSAYGGRADPKFRDRAEVTFYDSYQNLSSRSFRLSPGLGTHTGPRSKAAKLLIRKRVLRWSTATSAVAWYDVERYTVRFTYYVLR
jgi:subtilisin family serine protease/flagellar hook assembly protein FlgD